MVTPTKAFIVFTASIIAGLFLVQPARALTFTAEPFLVRWERVDAAQPIAQRRCFAYRNGRRVYSPCPPPHHKAKSKPSRYGTAQNSSYYKPWTGIQLCENCPAFK